MHKPNKITTFEHLPAYYSMFALILQVGTCLFVSVGLVSPTAFPFRSQKSIGFSTLGVRSVALLQVTKLTTDFLLTQLTSSIPKVYQGYTKGRQVFQTIPKMQQICNLLQKHLDTSNIFTTFAVEMSQFMYEYATNTIIIRYGIG